MELLTRDEDFKTSKIVFLPFINAAPSDYNTIFTALLHTVQEAEKFNLRTAIVTMDIYIKCDFIH